MGESDENQSPWSCLLKGRFPTTTESQLGSLTYSLVVNASTTTNQAITLTYPLQVSRAIPPGPDKISIRTFPPTGMMCQMTLPSVVHPVGKFPVSMLLSGVAERNEYRQLRWSVQKVLWRIDEHSIVKFEPYEKHKCKLSEGRTIQYVES